MAEVDPKHPKERRRQSRFRAPEIVDMTEIAKHYLEDSLASFRAYKKLAEKALEQITDEEFFATIDEESNSIAVVMKHMAGNMLSRWTDFLTTDGEKADRNRDLDFVIDPRQLRLRCWLIGTEGGIVCLLRLNTSNYQTSIGKF